MIFDGREFARQRQLILQEKISWLGRKPKLVSIYNPEHEPSRVYTSIKAKMAQELGVEFEAISNQSISNIKSLIKKYNVDEMVNGIMIQTPLLSDRDLELEIVGLIDLQKDVDGLRDDSPFMPATTRAVIEILKTALQFQNPNPQIPNKFQNLNLIIVVVGNQGMVGKSLMKYLPGAAGMDKEDFDPQVLQNADIIISAVGQAGLIKPEMVKEGVIAVDVGFPQGDFDPSVAKKAAFFTPVPGGVGPVTVISLFENLAEGAETRP